MNSNVVEYEHNHIYSLQLLFLYSINVWANNNSTRRHQILHINYSYIVCLLTEAKKVEGGGGGYIHK